MFSILASQDLKNYTCCAEYIHLLKRFSVRLSPFLRVPSLWRNEALHVIFEVAEIFVVVAQVINVYLHGLVRMHIGE